MLGSLPGILQPWFIIVAVVIFGAAAYLAYRWHRARPGRPPLHLDVLALALLALLTGGFFWRVLAESGIYMPAGGGDLTSLYFPTYAYMGREIQSGSLPLWNNHVFSGMPLAADVQSGLFYPLNWILFLFFQVDYIPLEWLLIAHYWLASAFMYFLLRDVGIRRLGSLAGAVVFAFCGFMTAHLGHMPIIFVATWIPLILLTFRRALVTSSLLGWVWALVAGLCAAITLLAGHVQIFAYGLLAVGVLWLYLLLTRQPLTGRAAGLYVAKGALLLLVALGLGSVQLIPSVEMSNQSIRSAVSYEQASEFPAQPLTLLNLFLPRVYGGSPKSYSPGEWQNTENWGYCGVVTLALAAAALVLRRSRMLGFFAIIAVVALLIMVGDLSIVGAWLYKFAPGFSKLRDSGRALVLLGLGLAGLAAYGLDSLVATFAATEKTRARRNTVWWLVGLSAALGLIAFVVLPIFYSQALTLGTSQFSRLPAAINDTGMLLLWLGLLAGVGWLAWQGRVRPLVAGALMVFLVVLDLFSPNSQFNPTTDNVLAGYQNFDAYAVIRDRSRDETTGIPMRVDSDTDVQDVWQPSSALLWGFYDTGGAFNPLEPARYDDLWQVAKKNPDSPLYDLTGAGLQVISSTLQHQGQTKWMRLGQYNGLNLYQNKNALPRLFLVHESVVQPDPAKAIEALRRFDVDPRHTVILPEGQPVRSSVPGTAEAGGAKPSTESAHATTYAPEEVDISVNATAPGWVVLTDVWYPGWQATLDGVDAPLLQAYDVYRAVHVDAGTHTIVMRFSPGTFTVGSWLTVLSLVAVAVALALLLFLTKRRVPKARS